jgi:ADP-ribose pyrophosphatase YjhB (NUDIX family)
MSSPLFKVNVSAVVKKDGKFLLIKRSEQEMVFPGHWGIPGGTVEETDKTLEDALSREFMEEVGIKIRLTRVISDNIVKRSDKTMLYIVYEAVHVAGEPRALEDTDAVEWKTYDEAAVLTLTPQTLEMLALCR